MDPLKFTDVRFFERTYASGSKAKSKIPELDISSDIIGSQSAPTVNKEQKSKKPTKKIGKRVRADTTLPEGAEATQKPRIAPPSSPPTGAQDTTETGEDRMDLSDNGEEEEEDEEDYSDYEDGEEDGEEEEDKRGEKGKEVGGKKTEGKKEEELGACCQSLKKRLSEQDKMHMKRHRKVTNRLAKMEEKQGHLLSTIADLHEKIDYLVKFISNQKGSPKPPITGSNTTRPTYAEQAAKGKDKEQTSLQTRTKPNQTLKNPTKQQRTLIITRESEETTKTDLFQLREKLNKALRDAKAPPHAIITSVTENARKNLVLLTRDDCFATVVLGFKDVLEKAIRKEDPSTQTLKPQESWSKVIVHGVSLIHFQDNEQGMLGLKDEIERHNSTVALMGTPRYLSRPERRVGKMATSAVVAVRTEDEAKGILRQGLMIGGRVCKTERFFGARPTDQCNNYQGFGHHWQKCKAEPRCRICSGKHKTTEHTCKQCNIRGRKCPHDNLKCANCNGAHRASDPECPDIITLRGRYPGFSTTQTNKGKETERQPEQPEMPTVSDDAMTDIPLNV